MRGDAGGVVFVCAVSVEMKRRRREEGGGEEVVLFVVFVRRAS